MIFPTIVRTVMRAVSRHDDGQQATAAASPYSLNCLRVEGGREASQQSVTYPMEYVPTHHGCTGLASVPPW